MKNYLILLVVLTIATVCVNAKEISMKNASDELPLNLEADHLEYRKENNDMFAVGNTALFYGESSIRADSLIIYMDENRMEAYGNVFFKDGESMLFGEELIFDWEKKTGAIKSGSGREGYWRYSGRSIDKISDEKVAAYSARFTSCDRNPPHYYIYGTKATVKLKKWMFIRNAFLMVDRVPVFYTPIFFRSLKDRRVSLHVRPGYSKSDGIKLLTEIGIPTSSNTYLKVLIDYYELKGTGKGVEFSYNTGNAKGSFYGYTIRERYKASKTVEERWNVMFNHWQRHDVFTVDDDVYAEGDGTKSEKKKIPFYLTSQASVEYQSDTNFNNDYFKEAYKRVNQNLNSSAAFTYNSEFATARVSTMRNDAYDQVNDKFEVDTLTAPRFDLYIGRKRISKLPLFFSFDNYFERGYFGNSDFYRNSGGANASLSNDIRLTRINTFTHSYSWTETWIGGVKNVDPKDVYHGRCSTNLNLRNRLTYMADLDIGHRYTVRMRKNSTIQDIDEPDKGIETNNLSAFLLVKPAKNISSRTSASYNLHRNKGEVVNTIIEKMSPVTEEINVEIPDLCNSIFFGRGSYSPINHWMDALQLGISVSPSKFYSFSFNSSYNKSSRGGAVFSGSLKFRLFERWYAKGTLGFKGTGPKRLNYNSFDFYDREVEIVRDLHCFIFEMLYRMRGESEEVLFNLMLKFDYLKRAKIAASVREYEFYPWR